MDVFQISFGKWPKEPQERIHRIYISPLLRKKTISSNTPVQW
jgi:hypothetical protein